MVLTEVKVIDSTTPLGELVSFELALDKGFDSNSPENKSDSISTRCYPSILFHALNYIRREKGYRYISYIQQVALMYSISLLQNDKRYRDIKEKSMDISTYCQDEIYLNSISNTQKVTFLTGSCTDATSISCASWTKDWISSNCHDLGINRNVLGIFLIIYSLNLYTFKNTMIREKIKKEGELFERLLQNRYESFSSFKR